jgi:hypothetical protein
VDTSNKENKVFNRNYWKLGKRERLTPDDSAQVVLKHSARQHIEKMSRKELA